MWESREHCGVLLDCKAAQIEGEAGGNGIRNSGGTESAGCGQDAGLETDHLDTPLK